MVCNLSKDNHIYINGTRKQIQCLYDSLDFALNKSTNGKSEFYPAFYRDVPQISVTIKGGE